MILTFGPIESFFKINQQGKYLSERLFHELIIAREMAVTRRPNINSAHIAFTLGLVLTYDLW